MMAKSLHFYLKYCPAPAQREPGPSPAELAGDSAGTFRTLSRPPGPDNMSLLQSRA